jgi:hypothetical protein
VTKENPEIYSHKDAKIKLFFSYRLLLPSATEVPLCTLRIYVLFVFGVTVTQTLEAGTGWMSVKESTSLFLFPLGRSCASTVSLMMAWRGFSLLPFLYEFRYRIFPFDFDLRLFHRRDIGNYYEEIS